MPSKKFAVGEGIHSDSGGDPTTAASHFHKQESDGTTSQALTSDKSGQVVSNPIMNSANTKSRVN